MFENTLEVEKYIKQVFNDLDTKKRIVLRIRKILSDKSKYYDVNPFINKDGEYDEGFEQLKKDKAFILEMIPIFPEIYRYCSPQIKDNPDFLLALSRGPLFYTLENQTLCAKSPLSLILDEHRNRRNIKKTNRDGSKTIISGTGLNCVKEDSEGNLSINDIELVLEALRSELTSFTQIKKMEELYRQNISYEASCIIKALLQGEKVYFLKYMKLESLKLASKEILENPEYCKQIEEIIQQWVNKEITSAEQEKRRDGLDLYDIDDLIH